METTPHDLPRGTAESSFDGILEVKAELGNREAQRLLEERRAAGGFGKLLINLADGEVYDAGVKHYGEFYASLNYGKQLLDRGMTYNGRPGYVTVVCRFVNGVQLKWWPAEQAEAA